jgi:hypothetical protein
LPIVKPAKRHKHDTENSTNIQKQNKQTNKENTNNTVRKSNLKKYWGKRPKSPPPKKNI